MSSLEPISPTAMAGNDSVGSLGLPWDDIQGRITLGDAVANPTYEAYRNTPWKTYFFRNDQADEIHLSLQMTHAWRPSAAVRFHLHLIPMVDPAATEVFAVTGYYSWATFGVETPVLASWTPFSATLDITPGMAFQETFLHCFEATAPDTAHESAVLLIYLKRDVGGADTYDTDKVGGTGAANMAILSADAHYQKEKDGTATEVPT